jgi:hypothetical protein
LGLGQARPHTALRGLQGHKSPSLMNRFPSLMALRLLSCGRSIRRAAHVRCVGKPAAAAAAAAAAVTALAVEEGEVFARR